MIYASALTIMFLFKWWWAFPIINGYGLIVLMQYLSDRKHERSVSGSAKWRDKPMVMILAAGYTTLSVASGTFAVLVIAAAVVGWLGFRNVPSDRVGIVRRRYGRTHSEFRNITPHRTRGVLAGVLRPGRSRWVFPALNEVRFAPRTQVAEGSVGLVTAREGKTRPKGRALGRSVECDNFQDGDAFLLNGGEQGVQVDTLPPGQFYINTALFEVEQVQRVHVPVDTIGLVTSKAGGLRPADHTFGKHVPCDDFQDGAAFLAGGGEQGRQLAILQGGAYYDINPALFDVTTVLTGNEGQGGLTDQHLYEFQIPNGFTGVVIALAGAIPEQPDQPRPTVDGHQQFTLPWEFLRNGGQRGVQSETLPEGTVCALNPYFVRVVLVPMRLLTLEWDDKTPAQSSNYDAHLDRITVTVQGHRLSVNMQQTLQIPPESAPLLVTRNGSGQTSGIGGLDPDPLPVQRFVERVLGASVVSYFNEIAAAATVKEFLEAYAETRMELATQVQTALKNWGVEARTTTLGEFQAEDPSLNEVMKQPAHEQMRGELLKAQRANAEIEDAIDAVRVEAERRRISMELETRIKLFGLNHVVVIEMLKEITKAPVPQFISGGDLSSFLETQPVARLEGLLDKMQGFAANVDTDESSQLRLPPQADTGEGADRRYET
ncbi:SPFH domain-containing protein (plasmid) [Streptomyces clavuligerus]|uniref:Band 7 protein n=2 Tax=Streptomyces clavuligerus TaxID=1901 RepID=D5SKI9_STRCL|nr:hypothetical protein BB341_28895 [Streptomyces clavuligerus]AXU17541.1 hypothetical protein D1794_31990 [Streptomyces clavuligerus]EFG04432.1 Band 7 protein [Streptomyces clavuligerus]MBY6307106.1 SPFH domain-containing protein [Streptomyces clavuligerus]QCS10940.1 hypothetical protein CRV15_32690 [Streptomyces clavuligerus]